MEDFEIWSEGYMSSDGSSPTILLSIQKANSFDEAVKKFIESDKNAKKYMDFNELTGRWTWYGCRVSSKASECNF